MPGFDRVVAEIPRASRENVRVSLRDKGGNIGLELRVAALNGRGAMVETSRGLRLPLSRIGETIAALQEAERVAIAAGHLPTHNAAPNASNEAA